MKGRLKGAQKGHSLLKKKADALQMRFRLILSKIIDVCIINCYQIIIFLFLLNRTKIFVAILFIHQDHNTIMYFNINFNLKIFFKFVTIKLFNFFLNEIDYRKIQGINLKRCV